MLEGRLDGVTRFSKLSRKLSTRTLKNYIWDGRRKKSDIFQNFVFDIDIIVFVSRTLNK